MKKAYVKPKLMTEYFTLSQNIASTCFGVQPGGGDWWGRPNQGDKFNCGWVVGDISLWIDGNQKCGVPLGSDEEVLGVCYNNPSSGYAIFGS